MSNIGGFFQKAATAIVNALWSKQNSTTDADTKTDNMYHDGNIGIGDFSSENVDGKLHIKDAPDNAIILDGELTESSPGIQFNNPDNAGDCARFTLTNRDNTQFVFENLSGADLLRMLCNGDLELDSGGDLIIYDGAGSESLRLNHENQVSTSPDLFIAAQGLLASESNLFLKSESGYISFIFGGAGSGTTGATERARITSDGTFQHDGNLNTDGDADIAGNISQGTTTNIVPSDTCTFSGLTGNYFTDLSYFRNQSIHNLGLWVPYASSAGGDGMWGVIPNDGSGNWHMFWNTTDGTPGPTRCANGVAFEWEVNDFTATDQLALKMAQYGVAGANISWLSGINLRPSVTATGAIGIKRTPTTYDFELQGRAAKTTTGQWVIISDKRLKKNINKFELGLDAISQIEPKTFVYKDDEDERVSVGYIAQDIEETDFAKYAIETWKKETIRELPATANGDTQTKIETEEYLAVDDQALVPALINAVKELKAKLDTVSGGNSELIKITGNYELPSAVENKGKHLHITYNGNRIRGRNRITSSENNIHNKGGLTDTIVLENLQNSMAYHLYSDGENWITLASH